MWMADEALLPGRSYLMKLASQTVSATVRVIDHRIDVNTVEEVAARSASTSTQSAWCGSPPTGRWCSSATSMAASWAASS